MPATEQAKVSAAEMNDLLEQIRDILRKDHPDKASWVVYAFDMATQAMVDKVRGHRGITMRTWGRYIRLLLETGDYYRVIYGVSKSHWKPVARGASA